MVSNTADCSGGMHGSHPVFNRFWRHYDASMAWMRAHYATVQRINAEFDQTPQSDPSTSRGPSRNKRRKWQPSDCTKGDDPPEKEEVDSSKLSQNVPRTEANAQHNVDKGCGNDHEDMETEDEQGEISEELLDFFETTRLHREQRELEAAQKQYENLENLMISSRPSVVNAGAETSEVFEARQRELKQLYGSQAATIHGMEMAIQCSFDRFAQNDVKLWPNIPLRL